jgi:hypothetical protein
MGIAFLADTALRTALAPGIFGRGEAEITQELSGVVKTCEVTPFRHDADGDGELHPTQGLEGLNRGDQAPGLYLIMEFVAKSLQAFGVLVHRPDVFLADDLLRGGSGGVYIDFRQLWRVASSPAIELAVSLPSRKS